MKISLTEYSKMVDYLDKSFIYVNSLYRTSGTSNAFSIDLSGQLNQPNNYDSITLLSASIPKSYYLIDSTNNTFSVTETGGNGTKTITIPVGNYSLSQMITTLNTKLAIAVSSLAFVYTATASSQTGKITFTQSTGASASTFTFTSASPYSVLGFTIGSSPLTGTAGSFSITSTNVVNFQITNSIQIMCDVVDRGVLSVIIPNESDFSTILYNEQNPSLASRTLVNQNTHTFFFSLLNGQTGKQLDLNGLDVQFTLVVFKANNYYNLMIEDRALKMLQDHYENKSKALSEAAKGSSIPNN